MEDGYFQKIQQWFEILDKKVETIKQDMVTKTVFENRFQALFTAISNLHQRVEAYKDQTDLEIRLIKRAIHDIEAELRQMRKM